MSLQKIKKIHKAIISTVQKALINMTLPLAYIIFVGTTSIIRKLAIKKDTTGWQPINDEITLETLKRQS